MNSSIISELELLSDKIEKNTANSNDYKKYESLLLKSGLSEVYIHSYIKKAGFNNWDEFIKKRDENENNDETASFIGGLLGIGLGIILLSEIFKSDKK